MTIRITVSLPADEVWEQLLAPFDAASRWWPGATACEVVGDGPGAVRTLTLADGSRVEQRLETIDAAARTCVVSSSAAGDDPRVTLTVSPDGERTTIVTCTVHPASEVELWTSALQGLAAAGRRVAVDRALQSWPGQAIT